MLYAFHQRRSLLLPFSLLLRSLSPPPMAAVTTADDASKYGFDRPEMYSSSLSNTVDAYDRHVFLCWKSAEVWPSRVEESDLPNALASALKARKDDIKVKTRLTICGECSGTQSSDGDVLIFPEMIKYRGLKESDADAFVDEVLVNGKPWSSGVQETLTGVYVFVCAHANRDKRCGVCGPILIEKFKEEIELKGLNEQVSVSACSHVGGHKYAGNVIIFGTSAEGKVTGDWYGYVTPNDVPDLVDVHIGKGEIIEKLWRGQMGLYVDGAEKEEDHKHKKEKKPKKTSETPLELGSEAKTENITSCCQGANGVSCCREVNSVANGVVGEVKERQGKNGLACLPAWVGKWDQSDILMAAGVVGAVATVAVAYSLYRRSA